MDDVGGGTGNHVLSLVPRIAGIEPVFATIAPEVKSRLTAQHAFHHVPPKRWFDFPGINQARILHDLYRFARPRNIEIIHTYFFWSILFGRALKRMLGARLLVENREDLGFQWGAFEYALLRMGKSAPDRVICVAEAIRRRVVEREGVSPERAMVIPNGLDACDREPPRPGGLREELGIAAGAPVVGVVANLRPVKRLDRLITAAPRLAEAVPGVRIVIAGRGMEEEALRAQAARLGLGETVVFAGFRPDVEALYATFDLTVLTSESEGCSITILESHAAGLPVVVTNVGGNAELVADGASGYVIPEWDEERFVARTARLLGDESLRRSMGEKGRAAVLALHALQAVVDRYAAVYRSESNRAGE